MSKLSVILVVGLGVIGLVAVAAGAVQIVIHQLQARAPETVTPAPLPAGPYAAPAAVPLTPSSLLIRDIVRSVMPALVSIILLIPSSVVVLAKGRAPEHQRWATATISSIVTYWLT